MLESKNKALTNLIASLKNTEGVDMKEFEKKMLVLNDRFIKVTQEATAWEQVLSSLFFSPAPFVFVCPILAKTNVYLFSGSIRSN